MYRWALVYIPSAPRIRGITKLSKSGYSSSSTIRGAEGSSWRKGSTRGRAEGWGGLGIGLGAGPFERSEGAVIGYRGDEEDVRRKRGFVLRKVTRTERMGRKECGWWLKKDLGGIGWI